MEIEVNGERREAPEGSSLSDLVASLSLSPERLAIERNREVIPRAAWSETLLGHGDKIEIVHFVGGGVNIRFVRNS